MSEQTKPRAVRRVFGKPLTVRRAALFIAEFTLITTLAGGVFAWLIDREDFPTLGTGLWWAIQTVTTVGYGDVVPTHTEGRVIATIVMLCGIAFLAVVTGTVTAGFLRSEQEPPGQSPDQLLERLDRIDERLARIEDLVGRERGR